MKNYRDIFVTLGASNHTIEEREKNDFYATDPLAVKALLSKELFDTNIWEPACGKGHISNELKSNGYNAFSTDIADYGYQDEKLDFLSKETEEYNNKFDIITNPPYKYAEAFCIRAINLCKNKTAMLARILFVEGINRYRNLFSLYPPKAVYVFTWRIQIAKNADFEKYTGGSAQGYAWFVWEKGYKGKTELCWFEPELREQ